MSTVLLLTGLSVVVQSIAAAAALRLHFVYGHRWAWASVSAAMLLMTVRHCITFYRIVIGDIEDQSHLNQASPLMVSTAVAFIVSTLLLIGVGLMESIFRDIRSAEEVRRREKDSLAEVVRTNEAEFRVAHDIQMSLFPTESPRVSGFDIAGTSHPALSAGGDLYDFLTLPDGTLGIVVADVSGHGVGPAIIMAETRAYLRAITEVVEDCGEILTTLNRFLLQKKQGSGFVTCFFVKLDTKNRSLTYGSAGHEAFLVDCRGKLNKLESQGLPLGLFEGAEYHSSEPVSISPGSLLVMVTDGILEAQSATGDFFGSERLLSELCNSRAALLP